MSGMQGGRGAWANPLQQDLVQDRVQQPAPATLDGLARAARRPPTLQLPQLPGHWGAKRGIDRAPLQRAKARR